MALDYFACTPLPKTRQHVDFTTRGNNTRYLVYTTHKHTRCHPHLGLSDHINVMPKPAYRPWVKVTKPVHKQVCVWPEGATSRLKDCFDTTYWFIFKQIATYDKHTEKKCTEAVTPCITAAENSRGQPVSWYQESQKSAHQKDTSHFRDS